MKELHWDWETVSIADLKQVGLHNYARHPSTDVLVACFAFDDEPIQTWFPGDPLPLSVKEHIETGGVLWGHNVAFEYEIWNEVARPKYGFPQLKIEQCHCSMVLCYAMALPGSLEHAAPALGIDTVKDSAGSRIMLQLCRPREIVKGACEICLGCKYDDTNSPDEISHDCEKCYGTGHKFIWWDDPEKLKRVAQYCAQDVEVERAIGKRLMQISEPERKLWFLDHKINARGVAVDIHLVAKAITIVEEEKTRLDAQMRKVTLNQVATCNANGQLTQWLKFMGVQTDGGVKANEVTELLSMTDLPPSCREALKLRQEAAKSSTAKLLKMRDGAGSDARMRGLFQFHGASTGRWSGRRVQLQNLPRPKLKQKEIDHIFGIMKFKPAKEAAALIDMLYSSPLSAISDCLRGFLVSSWGRDLIAADLSSIEARMLAWLAGEEGTLQIFRGHGKIYEYEAGGIYGVALEDVTEDQRQIGKVAVLSLGYGGGKKAFNQMAKNYGVKVSDVRAEEIKVAWRNSHQHIVRYWYDLENAAIEATLNPMSLVLAGPDKFPHRKVKFKRSGSFLWCRLPSGRVLCYPYPRIEQVETPWGAKKEGLTYMAQDAVTSKWVREKTYGGKLAENITQAASRCILAGGMERLEMAGYPVVMHVHDEVVCEVPEGFGSVEEMERLMTVNPAWADGLPLGAKGWRAKRYRK